MSGGVIRCSLKAGKLIWRDLLQVTPCGNQGVSVSLTADGKHVSDVSFNGKPLQEMQNYRMASNSFTRMTAMVIRAWIIMRNI